MDTHCSLWHGLAQCLLDKLQRVQNAAERLVSCTRKHDSIAPVFIELHWLPIKQRISYKILLLTYKALNTMAPQYISDLLAPCIPVRTLRSSTSNLLQGHPTNRFGKLSVRKALNPLRFSKGNFHLELS